MTAPQNIRVLTIGAVMAVAVIVCTLDARGPVGRVLGVMRGPDAYGATQHRPTVAGSASVDDAIGDNAGVGADLQKISLVQVGPDVRVKLTVHPASADRAHPVCIIMSWKGAERQRACLRRGKRGATLTLTDLRARTKTVVPVVVTANLTNQLQYTLPGDLLKLPVGTINFLVGSTRACGSVCADRAPDAELLAFKRARSVPTGCWLGRPDVRLSGPKGPQVGLSFDDGPGPYTPRILKVLDAHHVHATFFQVGVHVLGSGAIERRILGSGSFVQDHSWKHELRPSRDSMSRTKSVIAKTAGFTPCLFRPPYGDRGGSVVSDAHGLGLRTIIWNVDPQDWSSPGSGAIAKRVMSQVRPGSIILLHDGPERRAQTLSALPVILDRLAARGLRPVPIETLLGAKIAWRYTT